MYKKGRSYISDLLKEFQDIVIKPKNKEELQTLIKRNYPLLLIDVSNITDFEKLFFQCNLSWESPLNMITFWNIKNSKTCEGMFENSNFNQPIEWNLKSCEDISAMFFNCYKLNKVIKLKNTRNIKDASCLFSDCGSFNKTIELNLENCEYIAFMFSNCYNLNKPVKLKNLQNVKDASFLFDNCYNLEFKNIKTTVINLLKILPNIDKLETEIDYKLPEFFKKNIAKKSLIKINII